MPGGSEKILVVEDEVSLQTLICRILEINGYSVTLASGPEEVNESDVEDIDLLLSDMVMPGGNGLELFEKLSQFKPELKVVFMSGYTEKNILSDRSEVPFLQKPFSPKELANTVRKVLDS